MQDQAKKTLLGMTLDGLRSVVTELGLKPFAARQIAAWLYDKRVTDIEDMTDLSKHGRAALAEHYCIGRKGPIAEARSADGTIKYLFEGIGGRDIEAVYIPDRNRATLCVSSQAGCRMQCSFCMTGRQGFHGNLTAAGIINQILSVPESDKLTNIVFMGMGEPTDNLEAVLEAIEILTAPWGLAWSPKRITVSSIGQFKGLKAIVDRSKVHIAISVHSPVSSQRASLMPVEKAYPIKEVFSLLRGYDFAHQRRLSVEYIMWRGVNDSPAHADMLARLIKGSSARVNLIRFHKIPDSPLEPTSQQKMEAFRDRLNSLGVTATIRASRGEDIMAACGMLAGRAKLSQNSNDQSSNSDI